MDNGNHHTIIARIPTTMGIGKDDQHGRDEKQEKERDILIRRTRAIYDNLDRFTNEDNRFPNKQIQYWEQAPNHAIAEWLEIAERIAKKYKETATQKKT